MKANLESGVSQSRVDGCIEIRKELILCVCPNIVVGSCFQKKKVRRNEEADKFWGD